MSTHTRAKKTNKKAAGRHIGAVGRFMGRAALIALPILVALQMGMLVFAHWPHRVNAFLLSNLSVEDGRISFDIHCYGSVGEWFGCTCERTGDTISVHPQCRWGWGSLLRGYRSHVTLTVPTRGARTVAVLSDDTRGVEQTIDIDHPLDGPELTDPMTARNAYSLCRLWLTRAGLLLLPPLTLAQVVFICVVFFPRRGRPCRYLSAMKRRSDA